MKQYIWYLFCALIFFTASWWSVFAKNEDGTKTVQTSSTGTKLTNEKKDLKEKIKNQKNENSNQDLESQNSLDEETLTWSSSQEYNEIEKKKTEIKLKRDINAYIIESYKAQWNKIIKDLSIKLTKTIPDLNERKVAYQKIQESLKIRLEKTEETEWSSSKKEILQEFLRHLIYLLDKKIDEIEK